MTASRPDAAPAAPDAGERRIAALLAILGLLASSGCAGRVPMAGNDLLLPVTLERRWSPEPADRAAAALAAAALASSRSGVESSLQSLRQVAGGREKKPILQLCEDLANATLDDDEAYRRASRKLAGGWGTDPSLEARLEQEVGDDRLKLARRRSLDTWEKYWARTFNAVSQPLGSALIGGFVLAPINLATSGVRYLASFSNDEPLDVSGRQALALRKDYLTRNPDGEKTPEIRRKVVKAEAKLDRTLQRRRLREARAALRAGSARLAVIQAERALRFGPSDKAERIRDEAQAQVELERDLRRRTLESSPIAPPEIEDSLGRQLATTILASSPTTGLSSLDALQKRAHDDRGRRGDEARFVLAMAHYEAHLENDSWRRLAALAARDPGESHMSRHAWALLADPWQNPYRAFKKLERRQRGELVRWRLLGDWAKHRRYPNLPRPVAQLIELPAMAQMIVTAPIRLIFGRWQKGPDFQRPTALAAYRYLARHPSGEHARELLEWLFRYEKKRGNSIAALRIADFTPGFDSERRGELAEESAAQALAAAERATRSDRRSILLRQIVRQYPDTPSGKRAGRLARLEVTEGSAQRIRMTRSFLKENPRVAGEQGLGLNPLLLNDEIEDGELHPRGVSFLGGRRLRIDLVGREGDDEDDEPDPVYRTLSSERLARLVSTLDETTRRNQLIDGDDRLEPDADRDRFIERARLGLAGRPDERPTARSTYVYKSMRERYGMVRGRESILPFDLVLQGSFADLSLGAFPRWRPPKQTPDAFLYR